MHRLYAVKENKQINLIEYTDLDYGFEQMTMLYPDCEIIEESAELLEILNPPEVAIEP